MVFRQFKKICIDNSLLKLSCRLSPRRAQQSESPGNEVDNVIQCRYYVDKLTLQNHPWFNVATTLIDRRWNDVGITLSTSRPSTNTRLRNNAVCPASFDCASKCAFCIGITISISVGSIEMETCSWCSYLIGAQILRWQPVNIKKFEDSCFQDSV